MLSEKYMDVDQLSVNLETDSKEGGWLHNKKIKQICTGKIQHCILLVFYAKCTRNYLSLTNMKKINLSSKAAATFSNIKGTFWHVSFYWFMDQQNSGTKRVIETFLLVSQVLMEIQLQQKEWTGTWGWETENNLKNEFIYILMKNKPVCPSDSPSLEFYKTMAC